MKSASPRRTKARNGITLVELTVVLAVLLTLAAVLMTGSRAWRRGTDRTSCVINLRNVQTSVRAYQNLYGYAPGTRPVSDHGSQSIIHHLMMKGYISEGMHEAIAVDRHCPGGGDYLIPHEDVFPPDGELYLSCSLAASRQHRLPRPAGW